MGAGGGVKSNDAHEIAKDLSALAAKEITFTAPVDSVISLNRSIDAADAFPATFTLPIDTSIPLSGKVTGLSSQGQPIQFDVSGQSLPLKGEVTLDLAKAAAGKQITIRKDIPVQVEMTAKVSVGDLYGKELQAIIDKLNKS